MRVGKASTGESGLGRTQLLTEKLKPQKERKIRWFRWWKILLGLILVGVVTAPSGSEKVSAFDPNNQEIPSGWGLASLLVDAVRQEAEAEAKKIEDTLASEVGERVNPYYQPYSEIMAQGIEEFKAAHPDIPVVWHKSEQYFDDTDLIRILLTPITAEEVWTDEDVGTLPIKYLASAATNSSTEDMSKLSLLIKHRLPPEILETILLAESQIPVVPGTDLYNQAGDLYDESSWQLFETYYNEIKQDLETIYQERGGGEPLSQSAVLAYFLDKYNGDLNAALSDLSGFMKQMRFQINWLRKYIQDQHNPYFSLNDLPPFGETTDFPGKHFAQSDLLLYDTMPGEQQDWATSIWGLSYHSPYMVKLLSDSSPEVIKLFCLYEYINYDHVAEPYKEIYDFLMLDELYEILALLESYSR